MQIRRALQELRARSTASSSRAVTHGLRARCRCVVAEEDNDEHAYHVEGSQERG